MRTEYSLAPIGVGLIAAFFLFSSVLMMSDAALAADPGAPAKGDRGSCACPGNETTPPKPSPRPSFADLKASLDESDRIAALEAVQVALSEVGDGASYVWYRRHGRLNGVVHPTTSFKDASGKVCRHIVVVLATGSVSKRTEGVACRTGGGIWQLEG